MARKSKPKQRPSKRMQQRFWLDAHKPDEADLLHRLDTLKKSRQYSSTLRDALTLLFSLQDGRLDVFDAMFPDAVQALHHEGRDQATSERLDQIADLIKRMDSRPDRSLGTDGGGIGGPSPLAGGNLPKPAPVQVDDDADLVAIKRDTSTESAANFLLSAFALQQ